jgi:hypothetical protein
MANCPCAAPDALCRRRCCCRRRSAKRLYVADAPPAAADHPYVATAANSPAKCGLYSIAFPFSEQMLLFTGRLLYSALPFGTVTQR